MTFLRAKLLSKAREGAKDENDPRVKEIESKFKDVEDLKKSFIDRIYAILKENYVIARENPYHLVTILRIVYSEDSLNNAL